MRFEDISLYLQKGKVLDEFAENWLKSFEGYILKKNNGKELTQEEKIVLAYFYKSELLNQEEKYNVLLTPDNNHSAAISRLQNANLIHSHTQKQHEDYFIDTVYLVDRELIKKRAIRNIFNKLESQKFILRKDGKKPNFKLNEDFNRTPSLFD